ncbi:alpha/beta hydrolase family protein [Novosphingobium mangrovi (ex Hu et al. 2023)]|uniref:S9 family peptidase n=1 Tax=Novosphingobium mangrovi (ex Hu et al. 2023) TaxID=2930094 RepID=A0ABT0ACP9_9SPHN|nr:S9 family peptidase [Novosphingobium mangrovi (ex Hu et al. 2023)]MCJ1960975.1 S9 family peptidase [Novosphingobium mangrovi (ex Hu et al. 2023)]
MKLSSCVLALALGLALVPTAPSASASTDAFPQVPLITRSALFGNPTRIDGQVSPDGQWISFIAPRDGVMNLWIAPRDHPDKARPLTAQKGRPLETSTWTRDSRQLLFVTDTQGDENYRLYGVDVATGRLRNYTPYEKTRAQILAMSREDPGHILIGLNKRDPRWHDVYRLDLVTGELQEVMRGDGYARVLADRQLRVRLVGKARADGGADYFRLIDGEVEATPFVSIGLEDALTTNPLSFTEDGKTLYWLDSRGRDTAALMAQDFASGAMTLVGQDRRADVESALFDPGTGRAQGYEVNYLRPEYTATSPAIADDLAYLKGQDKGLFTITSRTDDDSIWIVRFDPVTAPESTWLYDRRTQALTELFVTRPELEGAPLAEQIPVEITARDGKTLVSYLTLPRDAKGPVPMVLFVHGGPWARDQAGFQPYQQWLANRGYAVLAVNFRGSTGFGKSFIAAGNLEWGRKMHQDLIDAVDWAIARGVTRRDSVAILGGSYGGYATLVGMTMTPERFACGVDMVGPSNLQTLMNTFPAYWGAQLEQFYRRMGDPRTEDGRAMLAERSPINHVDAIRKPLLIAQGANDPRVNIDESDQIVAAMTERGIPVTYLVFPDEGHGFARPENSIAFAAASENFLQTCLGGRAQPMRDALANSSAEVRKGGSYIGIEDFRDSGEVP